MRNEYGVSAAFRDNFTHTHTQATEQYKVPKWFYTNKCKKPRDE